MSGTGSNVKKDERKKVSLTPEQESIISNLCKETGRKEPDILREALVRGLTLMSENETQIKEAQTQAKKSNTEDEDLLSICQDTQNRIAGVEAMLQWYAPPIARVLGAIAYAENKKADFTEELSWLATVKKRVVPSFWSRVGLGIAKDKKSYFKAIHDTIKEQGIEPKAFSGITEEAWERVLEIDSSTGSRKGKNGKGKRNSH